MNGTSDTGSDGCLHSLSAKLECLVEFAIAKLQPARLNCVVVPLHEPLPPHLVEKADKKHCSVCKEVIEPKDGSLSKAFRSHIEEKHHPTRPVESKSHKR